MLSIHDTDNIVLEHCSLSDNQDFDDQLHVVYATISISNCSFSGAPMDGVDLDISQAELADLRFINNGNDGLDLMESRVKAVGLEFVGNGDKGVSVGEQSQLDIDRSRFMNNPIAIQVKDRSTARGSLL